MKKRPGSNARKTDTATLSSNWQQTIFWPVFFTCQLISLALLSWHLLAQFHFAYPLGYRLLGLDQHIAEFAPQNRFKDDFEFTASEEHWRLFGEISDAVQNSGKGLQAISYQQQNGRNTPLMHEAEVIHLQDVANLIDRFYLLGLIGLTVWLGMIGLARWKTYLPPTTKKVMLGFLSSALAIAAVVMLLGPTAVFYWLHVQVFPEGHQWFFYYEDSLMTTLMKAPDIFAFIALLLVSLLIVLWCLSTYFINLLLNPRH
uniref:lipoprotein intramolecular transacylase Lit n=1 Tax=Cellvibrio fontiphilus TaxID=1815559 RepID=UPI002B4BA48E|nr:DUF1461 domain-containing protein [Cellvibrio fontiphilus]